jgi:hypothetical protein
LDAKIEAPSRYEYLRDLLSELRDGDVVITFNWDTLAERALAELKLWTPVDGYGLNFRRLRFRGKRIAGPRRSAVKVLKLHGSVGWYASPSPRMEGEAIRLDGFIFLRNLGFECDNEPFEYENPDADTDYSRYLERYWDRPLIVYPTFLKAIAGKDFASLWHQAATALSVADTVDIYGYSLPESDGAGRVLVNQLRFRLGRNGPVVHVHDPSRHSRRIWRSLLGRRARITSKPLG